MTDPKSLSLDEKRKLAKELLTRKLSDETARAADEPIAIVGIGCRYPGGITDPESFWQLLDGGVDAMGRVPPERWDADALYDADPDASGKTNTREGGFLTGVDRFDARFFGLSAREAVHLDPQHRLLLETSWEALERAGIAPHALAGTRTGVFVGIMWQDYDALQAPTLEALDGYTKLGTAASVAAGRISYHLGLHGPSLTVDTACSSSLVTLHLACQSLRAGECEVALAGGATVLLTPTLHVEFAKLHGLAPDGRCKSFSAAADGVGWSEGCGMLVLKRLTDAQRAGDRIWGVVRGSAVNQDGRSNGLTAPSGRAQEMVLRQALGRAGVSAGAVDYVEAHGTGTALGDPIEAQALGAVYGAAHLTRIGSVKSNLGHTMAAAGVAGIIKVLLALRHQRLPASLHAAVVSPHVPWEAARLQVMRVAESWPAGARPRLAGVSSFGISGTNAHVIIAEPPAAEPAPATSLPAEESFYPVLLSGQCEDTLVVQGQRLAAYLVTHPELRVVDVAHTLARGRSHFASRAVLVAKDTKGLLTELHGWKPPATSTGLDKVAFLCTGQGSQYPGMGRELYRHQAAFRGAIDACVRALDEDLGSQLLAAVLGDKATRIDQTELTQPALFALGVALDALWRSWGVRPQLLLGHSVGEYVAACIAGVFSIADGVRLVAARGRLMQSLCGRGVMVAVDATEAEVAALLPPQSALVSIAAINGPQQTVIAGDEDAVMAVVAVLVRSGLRAKRLAVSHAFHSPLMQPMLESFAAVAAKVQYSAPRIPIVSNVTGALGTDFAGADYWVRHVLAPVRFADGMQALYQAGVRGFVEIGPQPTLCAMGAASLPEGSGSTWLPSLRRGQDDLEVMLRTAGALWTQGVAVDFASVVAGGRPVELPTYPFARQRFWVDTLARSAGAPTGHPLVGTRLPTAAALAVFESLITGATLPWLGDHLVFAQAVVPGAALVEWAHAAAALHLGEGAYRVGELVIERALVVPGGAALRAQVVLTASELPDEVAVAIYTRPAASTAPWTRHAVGKIVPGSEPLPSPPPFALGEPLAPAALYSAFAEAGLRYGPAFQAVRAAWRESPDVIIADVALMGTTAAEARLYRVHPVLLDAALHSLALADGAALRGELFLPVVLHDVQLGPSGAETACVRAVVHERSAETIRASVTMWNAQGECIARVGQLECRRVTAADLRQRSGAEDLLFLVVWQEIAGPAPTAEAAAGRRFLLIAASDLPPLAQALAERLRALGGHVTACGLDGLPGALAAVDTVVYFAADGDAGAASALAGFRLAQAVAQHTTATPRLVWVTERGQAALPLEDVTPGAAAHWGMGRALSAELPAGSVVLVDVAQRADRHTAELLLAEVAAGDGETQVALRQGRRLVARLTRAGRSASPPPKWPLTHGSVLITGGLGGLGLTVARHLVQTHGARRLILLGRRPPDAAAQATIDTLRAQGAAVLLVQADVTDRAALAQVVAAAAPLCAVVHAAGVGGAALFKHATPDQLRHVLAAKTEGAWNLHELTREQPLAAFVLFSSIAAVAPDPGLGAYATANAFLDGLAHYRRARGLPAHSIGFGPWAGAGMMREVSAADQQRLPREGFLLLDPEQALAALDAVIARDAAHHVVLALDHERRQKFYGQREIPSLWRQLVRASKPTTPRGRTELLARLDDTTPAARQATLAQLIREELCRVLNLPPGSALPDDKPLLELGVDSLVGIELRNRLGSALGIELSATVTWDHRSVRALATHLASRLTTQVAPPRPSPTPAPRPPLPPAALRLHPELPYAPLFGIGGGLGGGTYLKDLAVELGPLQPFYTMPYPGLESDAEPLTRVEALAAYFLTLLQRAHPRGPYVLVGHSFGGIVAFEMAQQLVNKGESVLALILLDTWTKATITQKKITQTMPRLEDLLAPFIAAGHAPENLALYAQRFERIWRANGQALDRYEMTRFAGDVTLVVPEDDLFGLSPNVEDWRRFCGTLQVRRTAGNHATMALAPHARRTAQIIRGLTRGAARSEVAAVAESPPEAAPLPLTLAQRWMWLLQKLDEKSPRYNVFFGLRAALPLDHEALERALARIFDRHEALRLSIAVVDGEPQTFVQAGRRLTVARHDLSTLDEPSQAAARARIKASLAEAPFDLAVAPLGRAAVLTLANNEHLLLFCFHHAIMDGLSAALFMRELLAAYTAEVRGITPDLPHLAWGLADFVRWEREQLTAARLDTQRAYWRRIGDGLSRLQLPVDRSAVTRSGQGGLVEFVLDAALTTALHELERRAGCSLYMVLVAGFAALLGRYGAQDDFAIATVVSNRSCPEVQEHIGCFVNTVLLRVDLSGEPTVRQHLERVRAQVVAMLLHKELPFSEIVRVAAPDRWDPNAPFVPACFVFEKMPPLAADTSAATWTRFMDTVSGDVAGTTKFDLSLSMQEADGRLHGSFIYERDLFDAATVTRMVGHFTTLLGTLVGDDQTRVAELPLLTSQERQQILTHWNDTARPRVGAPRLHELFEQQAARVPERTAIVHGTRSLTYGELDRAATQLAHHLRGLGIGREVLVGVCVERSLEMVTALLAVLKAGGAYVPLDPSYPRERLRFMLADSGARVVLVSAVGATALDTLPELQLVRVDHQPEWPALNVAAEPSVTPRDLAYLIYTSGSTGKPKAVAIEHASAVELVQWALQTYPAEVLDGVLASTSICFDLSVFELFVPLAAGGKIVLVRDALALAQLDPAVEVRLVNTVPSAAAELVRQAGIPASVRVMNLAGEPLAQPLVEAIYAQTQVQRVYDLYGPSETTTYSTCALRDRGGVANIGRPISNTRVYILDARQQPVPIGVVGEICIAGAGLARGYLGPPARTAERFVADPFVAGARMYRTGDRARFFPDGTIEFLGRSDGQIKLRGFRIELGEIEAALRTHESIGDCAVTVRTDVTGGERLVAYVVGRTDHPPPLGELRAHLLQTLPHYMLPQNFVALAALPRTKNGKLDRQALPAPDGQRGDETSYVPPAPGVEATIARLWQEALHLDRVGRADHFFALGGHSLLATQVASRLAVRLGRPVAPTALFQHPVLQALAAALQDESPPPPDREVRPPAATQKQAIKQVGRWIKR